MSKKGFQYVYGPVPSRRLGRSLGIDLVPFKTCTYDCIYCQLGRTDNLTTERREYCIIDEILQELKQILDVGDKPDYISLAGSGEPTLNSGMEKLIKEIKKISHIPVAVLTNGSLLWNRQVQDELMNADLILPSLDAGDEDMFRRVNRPHGDISFKVMVEGIAEFTKRFPGEVRLEILLLSGVSDTVSEVKKIADLVEYIKPARVQLNTASRPPAEKTALAVSPDRMSELKGLFSVPVDIISETEISPDLNRVLPDNLGDEIMALLERRPCTSEGVAGGLGIHIHQAIKYLTELNREGKIYTVNTGGRDFYATVGMKGKD